MLSLSLLQLRLHGLVPAHELHSQFCQPCLGMQPDLPQAASKASEALHKLVLGVLLAILKASA